MELELKLSLSGPDEVARLVRKLGRVVRVDTQINVYFDDPEQHWRKARWSLRLRQINGDKLVLTLKSPGAAHGDFIARGEWERELSAVEWPELRSGQRPIARSVAALLEKQKLPPLPADLDPTRVRPDGFTETERQVFLLPGEGPALHVELDRTRYPDGSVYYELELEIPDPDAQLNARARLTALLGLAGVSWQTSTLPKIARMRDILDRMKSDG